MSTEVNIKNEAYSYNITTFPKFGYGKPISLYRTNFIEINNELEVFVQISKTDVGLGNNRGRRPRLLQNPNEVFDICTNTYNKLLISILL